MKRQPVARPRATTSDPVIKAHEGTPKYSDYGHPSSASAPAELPPDHRAEGGNVYDLTTEQTTL